MTAIENAFSGCVEADGCTVFVPARTFILSRRNPESPILEVPPNTTFRGDGAASALKFAPGVNQSNFWLPRNECEAIVFDGSLVQSNPAGHKLCWFDCETGRNLMPRPLDAADANRVACESSAVGIYGTPASATAVLVLSPRISAIAETSCPFPNLFIYWGL